MERSAKGLGAAVLTIALLAFLTWPERTRRRRLYLSSSLDGDANMTEESSPVMLGSSISEENKHVIAVNTSTESPVPSCPTRTEMPFVNSSPSGVESSRFDCGETNLNCFDPRCYIPWLGRIADSNSDSPDWWTSQGKGVSALPRCQLSPHFSQTPIQSDMNAFQTECQGAVGFSAPPPRFVRPSKTSLTGIMGRDDNLERRKRLAIEHLDAFKSLTATPFSKWYDWSGNWIDHPPLNEQAFQMRHGYEGGESELHYKLHNACVRPSGRLAGFKPKLSGEGFQGVDETFPATRSKTPLNPVREWLSHIESLQEPPFGGLFLDTKVLIMPVFRRSDNIAHVFHRHAALSELKRRFTNTSSSSETDEKKYLTLFLHGSKGHLVQGSAHLQYTTVVTRAHGAVFVSRQELQSWKENLPRSTRERLPGNDEFERPLACFKEMILYQTSTAAEGKILPTYGKGKIKREIFPIYRWRSPSVMKSFVQRLRECAGVSERKSLNTHAPTWLLSTRSQKRRFTLSPFIIGFLAKYFDQMKKSSEQRSSVVKLPKLLVHEMRNTGLVDLVKLYSQVDVVLAAYGAGLFFSVMAPQRSIIVNIVDEGMASKKHKFGLNEPINRHGDYGGNSLARGLNMFFISQPSNAMTRSYGESSFVAYDLPFQAFKFLVDGVHCLLNQSTPEKQVEQVESELVQKEPLSVSWDTEAFNKMGCSSFTATHYKNLLDQNKLDKGGSKWRHLCALMAPRASEMPRLQWLCDSTRNEGVGKAVVPLEMLRSKVKSVLIVAERCAHAEAARSWSPESEANRKEVPAMMTSLLLESTLLETYSSMGLQTFIWHPPLDAFSKGEEDRCQSQSGLYLEASQFLTNNLFRTRFSKSQRGQGGVFRCFNRNPPQRPDQCTSQIQKPVSTTDSFDLILVSNDVSKDTLQELKDSRSDRVVLAEYR